MILNKSLPFSYFIIFILLCINIFIVSKYKQCLNDKNQLAKSYKTINLDEAIKEKIRLELFDYNKKINNIQLMTYSNTYTRIDKAIGSGKKLIFTFSSLNCSNCIDNEIYKIKKYEEKIGKGNIVIIAKDFENLNMTKYFKLNILNCNKYSTIDKELGLKIDEMNSPFYLIVDSSLVVRNIFVPMNQYPEITDFYLNRVSETFKIENVK